MIKMSPMGAILSEAAEIWNGMRLRLAGRRRRKTLGISRLSPVSLLLFALGAGPACTDRASNADRVDQPTHDTQVIETHLYDLEVETFPLEPFVGTGGAIEAYGAGLLVATPKGRLARVTLKGAVEYLAGSVPMSAAGVEPPAGDRSRVGDILLKERSPGVAELFVTHHYFTGECTLFRVSSTMLLREGPLVKTSGSWKTIFDARPCLRMTSGWGQAGGKMLMDGPDHLLAIFGNHAKNDSRHDPDAHWGSLVRIEIGTGAAETLTRGHYSPQGLARDRAGNLWATEHGPRGGDELNLLESGKHYGFPHTSYGTGYYGVDEYGNHGRHDDGFQAPAFAWAPSIGISGMVVNDERAFPAWDDDLLIVSLRGTKYTQAVLSGKSLFRVRRRDAQIRYVERIRLGGDDIRDITHSPDGRLALLLNDGRIRFLRRGDAAPMPAKCRAARLFDAHCSRCHNRQDEIHGRGPHLVGVIGRRAGAVDGYDGFSEAMRSLNRNWSTSDIERFLLDPQRFAPGTKMWQLDLHDGEAEQISKLLGSHGPAVIEDLAVGPDALLDDGRWRNMSCKTGWLTPGAKYFVQLRVVDDVTGNVTMSEPVTATGDGYGSIEVRWRTDNCTEQWAFRLKSESVDAEWRPWRGFVPTSN